jgi:hypothetical protein
MNYSIRITAASGDVVSVNRLEAEDQATAERLQADHWNGKYGHTADRFQSELLKDGEVVSTIGGWDDDEEDGDEA